MVTKYWKVMMACCFRQCWQEDEGVVANVWERAAGNFTMPRKSKPRKSKFHPKKPTKKTHKKLKLNYDVGLLRPVSQNHPKKREYKNVNIERKKTQ
jgi:hypothetical protein